jgi:hypothetical protein
VYPLDVPLGWSDPDDVAPLEFLLILAGLPLLLFVAIALMVYVPSLVRGEPLRPGYHPAGAEIEDSGTSTGELTARSED